MSANGGRRRVPAFEKAACIFCRSPFDPVLLGRELGLA